MNIENAKGLSDSQVAALKHQLDHLANDHLGEVILSLGRGKNNSVFIHEYYAVDKSMCALEITFSILVLGNDLRAVPVCGKLPTRQQ
jgi:hypothetical protein